MARVADRSVPDASGEERLFAQYAKVPELELPAGLHTITLEIWDELDRRDTDSLLVLVGP